MPRSAPGDRAKARLGRQPAVLLVLLGSALTLAALACRTHDRQAAMETITRARIVRALGARMVFGLPADAPSGDGITGETGRREDERLAVVSAALVKAADPGRRPYLFEDRDRLLEIDSAVAQVAGLLRGPRRVSMLRGTELSARLSRLDSSLAAFEKSSVDAALLSQAAFSANDSVLDVAQRLDSIAATEATRDSQD